MTVDKYEARSSPRNTANRFPPSLHRDARELDHLAPFLGLVGDQLAEFGRRHRLRDAADVGKPRHQLGIFQRFPDRLVEDVDDLGWRALGRRDAAEPDPLES